MRLDDNFEEDFEEPSESGNFVKKAAIGVSVSMLAIIGIAVAMNAGNLNRKKSVTQEADAANAASDEQVNEIHEKVQRLIDENGITSNQLDFWDTFMGEDSANSPKSSSDEKGSGKKSAAGSSDEESSEESTDGEATDAEAAHVNQTKVVLSDGTEEWQNISPFLTKNNYDEAGFRYKDSIMKYYESGKDISYLGADISSETGVVNFQKLKDAGVQFVMLRAGARGYGNGGLSIDTTFHDNVQKAAEAGLDIGVSFYSQAITPQEALEEANLVYENCKDYRIVYPIAFDMEKVPGDTARVENLTREEKSNIALTFLDALKQVGYKGIIYGNKEWLLKEINLSTVAAYDIWLSQDGEKPDYPYKFSMWQYTRSGTIAGINGDASLNICFINYHMK